MAPAQVDPQSLLAELKNELTVSKAAAVAPESKGGEGVNYTGILGNRISNVDLKLFDTHNWVGQPHPALPYPDLIPSGVNVYIKHQGTLPDGAKGGFAYVDDSKRMWLIAYDYPNNKVFVEAGSAREIKWEDVEGLLDASSNKAEHKDTVRGGCATALIGDGFLFAGFLVDPTIGN